MTARQLKITGLEVSDVRFPTSFDEHGSDASHPAPDYSAVYVRLTTNSSQFFTRPGIQWVFEIATRAGWEYGPRVLCVDIMVEIFQFKYIFA